MGEWLGLLVNTTTTTSMLHNTTTTPWHNVTTTTSPLFPNTTSFPNSTTTPGPQMSNQAIIGAIISVCGNLMISISLNTQKFAHMKIQEQGGSKNSYTSSKLWWLGLLLTIVGEVGNFVAYMFAPAALVAPLGTVTVISNAIIAPCFLKEKFRKRDGVGVLLALAGAALIIVFSPDSEVDMTSDQLGKALVQPAFLIYASVIILIGIAAYAYLRTHPKNKYLVVPLGLSTVCGSFTVLSVKAVSMLLRQTFDGDNQFTHPFIYIAVVILVATAITQVKFLNEAMIHFDATAVVPTFFVMFTVGAILIGSIFYGDFNDAPPLTIGMFTFGIFLTFLGVRFITGNRSGTSGDDIYSEINGGSNFIRNYGGAFDVDEDRLRSVSFQGLNPVMMWYQERARARSMRSNSLTDASAERQPLLSLAGSSSRSGSDPNLHRSSTTSSPGPSSKLSKGDGSSKAYYGNGRFSVDVNGDQMISVDVSEDESTPPTSPPPADA